MFQPIAVEAWCYIIIEIVEFITPYHIITDMRLRLLTFVWLVSVFWYCRFNLHWVLLVCLLVCLFCVWCCGPKKYKLVEVAPARDWWDSRCAIFSDFFEIRIFLILKMSLTSFHSHLLPSEALNTMSYEDALDLILWVLKRHCKDEYGTRTCICCTVIHSFRDKTQTSKFALLQEIEEFYRT